jgi:hypothetical protein
MLRGGLTNFGMSIKPELPDLWPPFAPRDTEFLLYVDHNRNPSVRHGEVAYLRAALARGFLIVLPHVDGPRGRACQSGLTEEALEAASCGRPKTVGSECHQGRCHLSRRRREKWWTRAGDFLRPGDARPACTDEGSCEGCCWGSGRGPRRLHGTDRSAVGGPWLAGGSPNHGRGGLDRLAGVGLAVLALQASYGCGPGPRGDAAGAANKHSGRLVRVRAGATRRRDRTECAWSILSELADGATELRAAMSIVAAPGCMRGWCCRRARSCGLGSAGAT